MTSGERSNKDVDTPVIGLIVFQTGKHDFKTFIVADSDLAYVVEWVRDESEEMSCSVDFFGSGFVKIFAEFSPEPVEHEFGCGFMSWIFGNESWVEVDVFFLVVLHNVPCFGFRCGGPVRVTCRFLM